MAQFKVLKKCYVPKQGMKKPGDVISLPDDSKRKYSFLEPLVAGAPVVAGKPAPAPVQVGGKPRASDKE